MGLYTGFVTFSVIWLVLLFVVLPVGLHIPEHTEQGMATSAPSNPMIKKKFLIVTLLTIPVFFIAKWMIETNVLNI
ncbi:MAG: DUF1467 family protein [Candidatus Paracaedibacteraceae bacterium]|nr:DUF1467 family protein [Candidatus Paracaedibacteraceae bacterium]